jgi:hypothetical protein
MVLVRQRAVLGPAVDGLGQRMGIVAGAAGLVGRRNHYDRCAFEGQRPWPARARPWRGERPARACVTEGNQGAHDGGGGGARARHALIEPITIMRPALQCGH